jgi:4-aminobutyrate aminotransferase/(S)-3-amino-2-methylpropionate transaminase
MNPEAPCYYRQDGFPELPVRFARGAGHLLHDDAGRAYTDLCAGFGAVSCGHANVTVNARLQRQLETLSAAAYSRTAIADECVAALDARLPEGLHTAALYSTGAEAIEQALRLARAMTGRRRFISFQGHFHGKTHGNMFLLQQYPGVYGPRPEGYATTLDFGAPGQDAFSASALEEALAQAAGDDLAGVVFEATIGYSGPYALPGEFAPALRRFCDRHGACAHRRRDFQWASALWRVVPVCTFRVLSRHSLLWQRPWQWLPHFRRCHFAKRRREPASCHAR